MITKEEIVLEVAYDEIDIVIIDALSFSSYAVMQLTAILRYRLHTDVSSMQVLRKLDYLRILGKIGRKRRNARIYEYFTL